VFRTEQCSVLSYWRLREDASYQQRKATLEATETAKSRTPVVRGRAGVPV